MAKIDLTKLQDAVNKVAGLAAAHAQLADDHKANQEAVDTMTAALLAAVGTPAEAVGVTSVAAALHPDALAADPAIAPHIAPVPPPAPIQ